MHDSLSDYGDMDRQQQPSIEAVKPFGAILRNERLARKVSMEEICWATKIKLDYLIALEEGNFSTLPAEIFIKGYIRSYAKYLEIDPEEAVAHYIQCTRQGCEKVAEILPQVREEPSFFIRFFQFLENVKRLLTGREDIQVY